MSLVAVKSLIRKNLLNVLRRFTIYRNYAQVPAGEVEVKDLGDEAGTIAQNKGYAITRIPPLTIDDTIYWKFSHLLQDKQQPTFVIKAENWRVWGNQGAVITAKGYLLKDVSREFEKPDHSIFKQMKLVPATVLKGTSAIINASGADMYYHWMFDVLPRIKLLRDAGVADAIDRYIVDYRALPFQKESIAALKIDAGQLSVATDHFNYHIKAEHLIVPSLPSKLDTVSAEACRFLIDTFLDKQRVSKFGKRIYLKRTQKRKLINADEVEAYLLSNGFETVECEKYTVAQQAAMFYNAEIIVGPHGAAFTNIVFCKPQTKVIEFFSPRWINPCYWTISNECSLRYYYLIGEGRPPDQYSDAKGTNADITLDINKLKTLFARFDILK